MGIPDTEKRRRFEALRAQLDQRTRDAAGRVTPRAFPADELRRTLRKQRAPVEPVTAAAPIVYRRDLPCRAAPPVAPAPELPGVVFEEAVTGEEVLCPCGRHFLIASRVDEAAGGARLEQTFAEQLACAESGLRRKLVRTGELGELAPQDVIFMDIETTGLSNSPLFLVGVMLWVGGGFEVRQFFARSYAEEAAVIAGFMDACADKRLLVSFNGKSYDVPYVKARAAVNGLPCELGVAHFDLLHESRRVWKGVLPDCRLQTLEQHVCRRRRSGDIPGQDIPEAYHRFVRTGDARLIVDILEHNRLDLVTLADLMTRFPCD